MARPLVMAICVLVALALLPRFTHGRPAIDNSVTGSASNTLLARDYKPEDFPDHKQKRATVTSFVRGSESISARSRQKRQSDQRLAELETLLTLSLMNKTLQEAKYNKADLTTYKRLNRSETRTTDGPRPMPKVPRGQM